MQVTEYSDYKLFVTDRVASLPAKGRGEWLRLARHLRVHTSLISQIFRGPRDLTAEQAAAVAEFFGLSEADTEYFILLVQLSRAGTPQLRRTFQRRIDELRARAGDLKEKFATSRILDPTDQARFYSRWSYSGVRLACSLPRMGSLENLASGLGLTRDQVRRILEFLIQKELVEVDEGGNHRLGPNRIHVPADSPWVIQHHRNWRLRVLERLERSAQIDEPELVFTSPLTIAKKDMPLIRALLLAFIDDVKIVVEQTEPDTLACLNLDWVAVAPNSSGR